MSAKPILEKLAVLADAAKYDASCASSGTVRGVTGKSASIKSMRGAVHELEGGSKLVATIHPPFLLRLPDRERAAAEREAFVADLIRARKLAA